MPTPKFVPSSKPQARPQMANPKIASKAQPQVLSPNAQPQASPQMPNPQACSQMLNSKPVPKCLISNPSSHPKSKSVRKCPTSSPPPPKCPALSVHIKKYSQSPISKSPNIVRPQSTSPMVRPQISHLQSSIPGIIILSLPSPKT